MRWLISVFTSPQEAEAIAGDLHEERGQIAANQGEARARRWYARQALRTVWHLAASPFREAPFSMLGLGILALLLTFPMNRISMWVAAQVVVRLPVYQYIPANNFWMAAQLSAPFMTGFVGAWIMRRRAMSTALSAFFALVVLVFVIDPLVLSLVTPTRMISPGFILWRGIVLLGSWGLTLCAGTAIGVNVSRRIRTA